MGVAPIGNVDTIIDADLALERCGDLFAADPIGCNMVAASLRSDLPTRELRVRNADTTLGAALWWGTGWTLTRLRRGAAELLANAVSTTESEADRFSVMGQVGEVVNLAGRWSEQTGGAFETDEAFVRRGTDRRRLHASRVSRPRIRLSSHCGCVGRSAFAVIG